MSNAPTISLTGTPEGDGELTINLDAYLALKDAGWNPPVSALAVKGDAA